MSYDALFAHKSRAAKCTGYKAADANGIARQRARRALTPEQQRRREIERLRAASTWQPLSPRELCELRRLVSEEEAERVL